MNFRTITGVLAGLSIATAIILTPASALAASATLAVTPATGSYTTGSTFTVSVVENSGDTPVDSARAELTYNALAMQVVGFSTASNPFTTCVSPASAANGNITTGDCTSLGSKKTGAQTLATVTFKVLASSGTGALTISPSSQVVANGVDQSVSRINGSYSFSAPAPVTPTPTPTSPTTPANNNNGHTSDAPANKATSKNTVAGTTNKVTTTGAAVAGETANTPTAATTADVKRDSTKESDKKSDDSKAASSKSSNKNWLWLLLIVVLAAAAVVARKMLARKTAAPVVAKKKPAPKAVAKKATATPAKKKTVKKNVSS